jgi:polyisoprenoid-binding protein YceI
MRGRILTGLAGLLLAGTALAADALKIDGAHSNVNFEIRHLVSTVTGSFDDFEGAIQFDKANPAQSSVDFTIQTASIDTGNDKRDGHLRTPDFFDAEKNPQITFKSKRIAKKSGDTYDVTGDFTMRGVTKEITIPVTYLGSVKGQRGETHGFKTTFTLNRKDYGVGWNREVETGTWLLGDDVDVRISLEAAVPPPPKPAEAAAPAATPEKK